MISEYPNDSSYFSPDVPEERVANEGDERARAIASLPILEDVLAWFGEQLEETKSVDNLDHTEETATVKEQLIAYALLRKLLSSKRDELSSKFLSGKELIK